MQDEQFWLEQFERQRPRLRAVAYRMLGSYAEADDALQEAWLRVARAAARSSAGVADEAPADEIDNTAGWLTTIVSRQCLNMLRTRATRREQPLGVRLPDPVVSWDDGGDPAEQSVVADAVSMALLVVLDTLDPPERLAFVLHDMFAVPFEEIGIMLDRTPGAARQLASRARRRVRGATPDGRRDRSRQRAIASAWLTAARSGDFDALVSLLDPEAVLRVDTGDADLREVHGARAIAGQAVRFRAPGAHHRIAVVNGGAGIVSAVDDEITAVLAFTVTDGLITEIDILADRTRLAQLPWPSPPYEAR